MTLLERVNEVPGKAEILWTEEIAHIGQPVPMHGVVTRPRGATASIGLVILNSGLLHHVGSCCFSVHLARAAAAAGVTVLRYDASGIGDSAPRVSDLPQDRRAVSELREVLDYLEHTHGIQRFAVMGLCSGAFTSFAAALEDTRIIGVTQIAPFAYRTLGWYVRHYRARLLVFRSWYNFVRRVLGQRVKPVHELPLAVIDASSDAAWDLPAKQDVEHGYRQLLARNVRLLNIMTGGESDAYLYLGQFRDMFPNVRFTEQFEEHYFPHANHILTQPTYQRAVAALIMRWIGQLGTTAGPTRSIEHPSDVRAPVDGIRETLH